MLGMVTFAGVLLVQLKLCSVVCLRSFILTPLLSICFPAFVFRPHPFSLYCKGCTYLGVFLLQSKLLHFISSYYHLSRDMKCPTMWYV